MSHDLLLTAARLLEPKRGRPRQSDLRRSISSSYCALFHVLATDAADLFVGTATERNRKAWTPVYRALDHGFAKSACGQAGAVGLPQPIMDCADAFVELQDLRHRADYSPNDRFTLVDAGAAREQAIEAIASLRSCDRSSRCWFAVHLLLKRRPG